MLILVIVILHSWLCLPGCLSTPTCITGPQGYGYLCVREWCGAESQGEKIDKLFTLVIVIYLRGCEA